MATKKKRITKSERLEAKIEATAPAVVNKEKHRGIKMYCEAVTTEILTRLSEGATLTSICNDERMPTWQTVHRWADEYPEFGAEIERARALGKKYNRDFVIDIADSVESAAEVPVAKLQIDQRWKNIEYEDEREDKKNAKPVDPKLVEATPDNNGGWKVLENGETANPIQVAIQDFMRKKGLATSGT